MLVSGGKLLLGESLLLLLLYSHAVGIRHIALLWHLLHLLMLLLLLEAWVRVPHLRCLLLHIHAWTARIATHLLSLCHRSFHLCHSPLHRHGLLLRLGGIFNISRLVLLLVLTLVMVEHLLELGHLVSVLYVLWGHARIRIVASKILAVCHALICLKCPLSLEHSHLLRCEILAHLAAALHHHAVRCILHADVGTAWLHHARRLRRLASRYCLRH